MKDRFLCRALRLDDNMPVDGYYVGSPQGHSIHAVIDGNIYTGKKHDINPATLVQCTGWTDRTGTLIYERDVLALKNRDALRHYIVLWDKARWFLHPYGFFGTEPALTNINEAPASLSRLDRECAEVAGSMHFGGLRAHTDRLEA